MARNVSSIAIACAPASPCLTSWAVETTEPEASETNEGLPVLGVLLGIETERRRHVSWAHVTRCACRPHQGGGRVPFYYIPWSAEHEEATSCPYNNKVIGADVSYKLNREGPLVCVFFCSILFDYVLFEYSVCFDLYYVNLWLFSWITSPYVQPTFDKIKSWDR